MCKIVPGHWSQETAPPATSGQTQHPCKAAVPTSPGQRLLGLVWGEEEWGEAEVGVGLLSGGQG